MLPKRLEPLPRIELTGDRVLFTACSFHARLLGLAFLSDLAERHALLIPRCSSVHTLGMRFPIDVVFLDEHGTPLRTARNLQPRRLAACPGAKAVLETRAGEADAFLAALSRRRAAAAGTSAPRAPAPRSR